MGKPKIRNSTNKKKRNKTKAKNRKINFRSYNKRIVGLNKKVRNAKVQSFGGITFKSGLEVYAYKKFIENNIDVAYEEKTFTILDSFEYGGKKIRAVHITPDFIGKGFIVETKGWATDVFKLRWKLFLKHLADTNQEYKLYIPRNQGEVDACIKEILSNP